MRPVFFVLRNTARAKRRGWIVSASGGVHVTINSNLPPRQIVYRWRTDDDDKRDAETAERERLRDAKLIEHEAGPEPSNKD
jgi:hypothetical protein